MTLDHAVDARCLVARRQHLSRHDLLTGLALDEGFRARDQVRLGLAVGVQGLSAAEWALHRLLQARVGVLAQLGVFELLAALTLDHDAVNHFLQATSDHLDARLLLAGRAGLALLLVPVRGANAAYESVAARASALLWLVDQLFTDLAHDLFDFVVAGERLCPAEEVAVVDGEALKLLYLVSIESLLTGHVFFSILFLFRCSKQVRDLSNFFIELCMDRAIFLEKNIQSLIFSDTSVHGGFGPLNQFF